MNIQILIAFCLYLVILLLIGFFSYRKQKSDADFIVGDRSLNFWVTALSAHASDMTSWLFMAFPAAIMLRGLPQSWIAIGLLAGMFFNWHLIATKLRIATEKLESYTLSTFFERHFQDHTGIIRLLTAVMSVIFLSCYISGGLIGTGMLLESMFGIDYYWGLSLAMVVILAYAMGGFITIAWTDLFQAIFLLAMIILVPLVAYFHLDNGWQSILEAAKAKEIGFGLVDDFSKESIFTALFLSFGWGLGYFGQPHIVTKFMGIKNVAEMHKSKYVGMSWMFIALAAAAIVGLVGIAFFDNDLANPELVFVEMVKSLFNPFTAGFILCGVLAASISTMDTQILVCASVLSEDLYKHLFNKNASPKHLLHVSRWAVLIMALFSLLIAFNRNATVLDTVAYAWNGLGSAFGPLVLMALYSKHANRYGAIAGILVGGVVAGLWHVVNPYLTSYTVPSMIPGFTLSLLSICMVSTLTGKNVAAYEKSG